MNIVCDKLSKGKKAQWFCNADKIHSYGYVPDLAKGTALLGNTENALNQIWNLPTFPQKTTGREWVKLFVKELKREPKFSVLPKWLLKTVGIFVRVMNELTETSDQYDRDYFFDSSKFNIHFDFKPTTNENAVKQIVELNKLNKKTQQALAKTTGVSRQICNKCLFHIFFDVRTLFCRF